MPYAVEHEIDDLAALIGSAGGSAHVFGVSSGGALALEAAAAGAAIDKLAVYEVPYDVADGGAQRHREYVDTLGVLLAEGRRGDAFALFMRMAGSSEDDVVPARSFADVAWARGTGAHPRLRRGVSGRRLPTHGPPRQSQPAHPGRRRRRQPGLIRGRRRRLLRKGRGRDRGQHLASATSDLDGQTHMVDPKALAPVLGRFFSG